MSGYDFGPTLAEQLWLHCGLELINVKEAVEEIGLYVPEEKSSINNEIISNTFLAKEVIQKAICVLHPEVKQTILDCLRRKNLRLLAFGEENGFKNRYTKYLEFFFSGTDAPRRRDLLQSPAQAPTPSPKGGSPISIPAPSPGSLPSSPQVPGSPPSAESPLPPFFPPNFIGSDLQPVAGGKSSGTSDSATNVQSTKQNNSHKPVVIAVAVTAAVTFCFAALLFFCYFRVCRNGGGVGRNDERPLLSLSLSDYSVGSSHKSFALGGSINNGKLDADTQSLGAIAGASKISAENSSQISHFTLKPPPGRLGNPPGLPPLKPPPGKETRPPLPPPVPPPSLKPTSSSPRPPLPGPPRPPPPGPPPPPIPSGMKTGPRPPPPPKIGGPPPRPPAMGSKPLRPPPLGPNHPPNPIDEEGEADVSKTKLKPFFWDKVLANPDQSMVWHQIKSGSFQFSEEMIETLFGFLVHQQNLTILFESGNELPSELLQTLLKMAPTAEEELKLRLFSGELSRLGPADRFLKVLVEIPFAVKRLESLLFMSTFQEEISIIKDSFTTLECAMYVDSLKFNCNLG
ncbi:formin homology5 [Actinidia rufa]|uniref:Formin homology5 n=1 Tax=Actinidia rufa TaxID=165716 RepID=A0A7J0G716_9ERIC|nr:formin homology5 [Actinidia rufa]